MKYFLSGMGLCVCFSFLFEVAIHKARNMVIFSEFWVCIFFRNACIFATAKRRNDSLCIIN